MEIVREIFMVPISIICFWFMVAPFLCMISALQSSPPYTKQQWLRGQVRVFLWIAGINAAMIVLYCFCFFVLGPPQELEPYKKNLAPLFLVVETLYLVPLFFSWYGISPKFDK